MQIRVSFEEKAAIEERAKVAGVPPAEFVRGMALHGLDLRVKDEDPEPTEDTPDPPKPDLSNLDERLTKVLGGSPTIEELGGGYKGRKAFEARVEDENVETESDFIARRLRENPRGVPATIKRRAKSEWKAKP